MIALTVCQPYAELIARNKKPIENRTWPTTYRGPLAIHAGKSRAWMDRFDIVDYQQMAFGAVVALVTLADCVKLSDLPEELKNHEHANGPFCFILTEVRRIKPYWCQGAQRLWQIPDEIVATFIEDGPQ